MREESYAQDVDPACRVGLVLSRAATRRRGRRILTEHQGVGDVPFRDRPYGEDGQGGCCRGTGGAGNDRGPQACGKSDGDRPVFGGCPYRRFPGVLVQHGRPGQDVLRRLAA